MIHLAGTDFSHLTNDELIKGIQSSNLPDYIRSKAYGIDVRETLAQMTEMTIQLGVNMGLSPDDALKWARKLQETVSQSEFDSWVATLLDGGPSIFMNTLSELQTTYPNGASGVALVRETDPAKIYVWNGTTWEDFGDYQGIEIKNGAVDTAKVADKAITPDKTDFISVGKNLFDKDNGHTGYIISSNGELTANGNYFVSNFILVEPSTNYYISSTSVFAWYDDKYNFISRVYQESGVFQSPATAKYMRVSASFGYLPTLSVTKGNELTPYEEFKIYSDKLKIHADQIEGDIIPSNGSITNEKLAPKSVGVNQADFLKTGLNLFNKDSGHSGYIISTDGKLTANGNYFASNYILVDSSTDYYISQRSTFAWYDNEFNFISRVYQEFGVFQSPTNAEYMRLSASSGYLPTLSVTKGSSSKPYEDYKIYSDKLKVHTDQIEGDTLKISSLLEYVQGKNLFNKDNVVVGSITPTNGNLNSTITGTRTTDYIEVTPGLMYAKSHSANYAFYDEHKSHVPVTFDNTEHGSTVSSFSIPEGAYYIRLSPGKNDIDSFQFEQNSNPTSYEPYGYRLRGLLEDDKTTVIENDLVKYPYPAIVNEKTYQPGGNSHSITYAKDGVLWATSGSNLVRYSHDGVQFTTAFDVSPYLNEGEFTTTWALYVSDTGRIIISTNLGRVLVSDEERTTMSEAFTFKAGYTNLNRGHCKYGKYIFMGSYLTNKNAENPGREVYMSRDHGATWELIFDKPIEDMIDPSDYHIHEVAFDPYSNMILISIGDGLNRQIHYSYDFGETWSDMFNESDYGTGNLVPIHPTCMLCFPDGIAFGSDELPEGISWWQRPKGVYQPALEWEDVSYKVKFGEPTDTLIGTYAMKGSTLQTSSGFYGVMPFRNHNTTTKGNARLYATGDGGRSWHEIFREANDSPDYLGFWNAVLNEEDDGIYIYGHYSMLGSVYVWKAKMPNFGEV